MSNRVHIICHLQSGQQQGERVWKETTEILDSFQQDFMSYFTDYALHAKQIAQQIISRSSQPSLDNLLVIGGDGTLHEVISALYQADSSIPVTYIPAGSGNDFARTWYNQPTPREIIEAMMYQRDPIDIPIFEFTNHLSQEKDIILNSMGFGFDAVVNHKQLELSQQNVIQKILPGSKLYKLALIMSLKSIPHFRVNVNLDGNQFSFDDASLFSVMNGPFVGGGIQLDNRVHPYRQELALVCYHDITASKIKNILQTVLKQEKYDQVEAISIHKGQVAHIQIYPAVRSQVDGEDLSLSQIDMSFKVNTYPFKMPGKVMTLDPLYPDSQQASYFIKDY